MTTETKESIFHVRLTTEQRKRLRTIAHAMDSSEAGVVRMLIKREWDRLRSQRRGAAQ